MAITKARQGATNEAVWWCKRAIAATGANTNSSGMNALARQNLRTLRGVDSDFDNAVSPALFLTHSPTLIHDRTPQAVTNFSALVQAETNSALTHYMYAKALTEANAKDTNAVLQFAAASSLLPEATFASTPTGKPAFLDFYSDGSLPPPTGFSRRNTM